MNKTILLSAASAAALLISVPVLAQDAQKPANGFVTLDLNWDNAPAESELDGDTMRQILERDQARVRMIQERMKAKAPAINPDLVKDDAPKADETVTAPVAPPDSSRMTRISGDQMRQIVERDRARAKAMGE